MELQDTQSVELELAMNGMGGPNCDPFNGTAEAVTQRTQPLVETSERATVTTSTHLVTRRLRLMGHFKMTLTLVNPPELYQYLLGRVTSQSHYEQDVIDAVLTGTILDEIGLAVGFQQRKDFGRVLYDATMNSGNLDFVYGATDWNGTLTTTALFTEIAIPVGDDIDVNVAVRYEDFDEIGQDTTDPKVTVLWRATDTITAPSLWRFIFPSGFFEPVVR